MLYFPSKSPYISKTFPNIVIFLAPNLQEAASKFEPKITYLVTLRDLCPALLLISSEFNVPPLHSVSNQHDSPLFPESNNPTIDSHNICPIKHIGTK